MATATVKRPWFQFGLPTLLGFVTLSAIVLALIVLPAERQRRAVAFVRDLGGTVYYEDEKPFAAGPPFTLRKWFDVDYVSEVVAVYLTNSQVGDADLERLHGLSGLQTLDLTNIRVSDAGLAYLKGMRLRTLYLTRGRFSEAGLAELRAALPDCDVVFATDAAF